MNFSTTLKSIAAISAVALMTACGGSESKNLFTQSFKPAKGQASIAKTMSEATGYWENTSDSDIHIRLKVEPSKLTVAIKCVDYDLIAQDSGSSTLDTATETVIVNEKMAASKKGDNAICYLEIPKGAQFSYTLSDAGMDIFANGSLLFTGLFSKIADLEK